MQPPIRKKATPEEPIQIDQFVLERFKQYDSDAWHKLMYVAMSTVIDDLVNEIKELKLAKAKSSEK